MQNLSPGSLQQMGDNTLALTIAMLEEDLGSLSPSSATFFDHFGIKGVVLTGAVRIPTLIALLITSCVFVFLVKVRVFADESWKNFLQEFLQQSVYYACAVGACLGISIVSALPMIVFIRISSSTPSIAFCFLGSFLGSLLIARWWRRVYIEKRDEAGPDSETYRNLTRLVLSGIIIGINVFV
jgi:hypothetical protein